MRQRTRHTGKELLACSVGWGALVDDLAFNVLAVLSSLAEKGDVATGRAVVQGYAALLCVNQHWRRLALQVPLCVRCEPTPNLLAWLRTVSVHRLEFLHARRPGVGGDQRFLGFQSGEQRFRAPVATLLATLDFVRRSAPTLTVLGGVHPRPGILSLAPFKALQRLSVVGNPGETCALEVLQGLPNLTQVEGTGYSEYSFNGLPTSVRHLSLVWSVAPGQQIGGGTAIHLHLPPSVSLKRLRLAAQRPLVLPGEVLAACRSVAASSRRVYLGLPLLRDAAWTGPTEVCQRFAAFLLEGLLEEVEVQAARCAIFQPSAERYDLATNEGLAGQAGCDELVSCLLHRHFQALHVEERTSSGATERPVVRVARRRTEPAGFCFPGPLSPEQRTFLQEEALAKALSFAGGPGPAGGVSGDYVPPPRLAAVAAARADTEAVLNHPGFSARCGELLTQLSNATVGPWLDLRPYAALAHLHAVWQGPPSTASLPSLRRLQLTAAGGSSGGAHFSSAWLEGAPALASVTLARFASADLSCLHGAPGLHLALAGFQPPGGTVGPATLVLPRGGFGPGTSLHLRVGAPPLAQQLLAQVQLAQLQAHVGHVADQAQALQAAAQPLPLQQQAVADLAGLLVQQLGEVQQLAVAGQAAAPGALAAVQEVVAPLAQQLGAQLEQQAAALAADAQQAAAAPAGVEGAGEVAAEAAAVAVEAAVAAEVAPAQNALPAVEDGEVASDSDDEEVEEAAMAGEGGAAADQPWVIVPGAAAIQAAVAAAAPGDGGWAAQAPGGGALGVAADGGQVAGNGHAPERLGDVTVQHEALLTAAGIVSITGAALRVRHAGNDPSGLLRALSCAPSDASMSSDGDITTGVAGTLRCLRLMGTSVSFVAADAAERTWSASEFCEWVQSSPRWLAVWDCKLSRQGFRQQLTLQRR